MNFFGNKSEDSSESAPQVSTIQSPYLNINPDYLSGSEEYILPEDAAPIRSRSQMMFSTIGSITVLGAGVGTAGSLRYAGLQWFSGKSKRMQLTSALIKNGGQMAQRFGAIGVLYCACSIICEKIRGEEDNINTLVGGATAGGFYMLPGLFGEKKEITAETKYQAIKRLPPAGRLFFGIGCGLALSGLICLYKSQGSNMVRDITKKT